MNVLKPDLQTTIKTLLSKGVSQREIERKTGIDRKTIRRYAQSVNLETPRESEHSKSPTEQDVATGSGESGGQIPHPGHRVGKQRRPSMPVRHVKSIGSGSKNS